MTSSLLVLSADDVQHLVRTALKPDEVIRCMARVFELVSGSEIGEGAVSAHNHYFRVDLVLPWGVGVHSPAIPSDTDLIISRRNMIEFNNLPD